MLKYAHENGCLWDEDTCKEAASNNNLDILKYARENGCPWDKWTCSHAASNNNLDMLKYAHENGCPWDEGVCEYAASNNSLDMLKYAHENGCPWDEGVCVSAAKNGHLDILKYAHENGAPWGRNTCSMADKNNHLECLKYAHKNGCPCNINFLGKDDYCESIMWCEYRCDICWKRYCGIHDSDETFKKLINDGSIITPLYDDVINVICSFIGNKITIDAERDLFLKNTKPKQISQDAMDEIVILAEVLTLFHL